MKTNKKQETPKNNPEFLDKINEINFIKVGMVENNNKVYIDFGTKDSEIDYYIVIHFKENKIKLIEIYHGMSTDITKCPYCEGKWTECIALDEYNEVIYKKLIKEPNVRLRWLKYENRRKGEIK